jgi:hypothetical protein
MDLFARFNSNQNFIEQKEFAFEFGEATPPARKRSGVCVVLGTHPCWKEDLDKVLAKYPKVDICGVNEAGRLYKLDHLATCHGDKLEFFLSLCEHNDVAPIVHFRDNSLKPNNPNWHSWPVRIMAGSGPFAAATMVMLGYDKVIMCGCPISGGGGYAFTDTHKSTRDDPRIGFEKSNHNMIKSWHNAMRKFKEECPEMAIKICSMSGVTQEIFGDL